MLRKIDTLILRSFVGPFFAAFSIILFVLVLQFLTKYMDDIFGKGFEADVLARVFVYACATLVTMALPLGILLSSLMTIGGLGERYELAALKSSGVGLFKTIRPLIYATIVITVFSAWFSFFVMPLVNLKLYTLLFDLGKVKPTMVIEPKHYYTGIDDYVIRAEDVNHEREMLYQVKIYDHRQDIGNLRTIYADSARMMTNEAAGLMMVELFHGVSHEDMPKELGKEKTYQYQRYYFDTLNYRIQLTGFEMEESDPSTFAPHHYMQNIVQLYNGRDSLRKSQDTLAKDFKNYIRKYVYVDSALVDNGYRAKLQEEKRQEKLRQEEMLREQEGQGKDGEQNGRIGMGDGPPVHLAKLVTILPDTNKPKVPPAPRGGVLQPAKDLYQVSMDKPVLEWFNALNRSDILNKAVHAVRSVKNFSVVMVDRMKNEELKERKFDMELHGRIMLPVSCLVFLLLGAPLGAIIRKGGIGLPILFSILFFIIFYILMMWGKKFAKDEYIPVWVGIWLPCLVMFPFGAFFTVKAAMDAPIFNAELWGKTFKVLGKFLIQWWWPFKRKKVTKVSFWDNPKLNLTPAEMASLPEYMWSEKMRETIGEHKKSGK